MLVSSETWDAGILAAISFENFSGRCWPLFIHDDGSVTEKQRKVIEQVLPESALWRGLPRGGLSGRTSEGTQNCLSNRRRHNLFLKFFDFPVYAPYDRFVVLDSDVIF